MKLPGFDNSVLPIGTWLNKSTTMKSTYKILFILMALFLFTGCEEEILDKVPEDRVDLETLFETPADAEAALIGVYQPFFRQMTQDLMFNMSLSARELYDAQRGLANRPISFRPALRIDNDGGVSGLWRAAYETISRANLVNERVVEIPDVLFVESDVPNKNRKSEIIAEALFLRAFCYYHMVLNWGDVPLVLEFPRTSDAGANDVERTPVEEIWTQIVSDFEFAEANLPWNHEEIKVFEDGDLEGPLVNSKGRVTRGAAKMMLAKIYLKDQEWQLAADKANEVIQSGEFELVDDWTTIFHNQPAGSQNSAESIWEAQTEREGFNNTGGYFFRIESPGRTSATFDAYSMFEGNFTDPRDVRQGFSMFPRESDPENFITQLKYYNRGGGFGTDDPFNFVMLRLGEAYLIRAEALNELSYGGQESLDIINRLRARAEGSFSGVDYAGIAPFDYTLFPDQASFRQAIRDERWRELMFEGHQWYDLLRYDSYDNGTRALTAVYLDNPDEPGADPGKILWPIPDREVRVNKELVQNPGY